jgi:hypothetical protein
MTISALDSARAGLAKRHTTATLEIRHARIGFERYARGHRRTKPHST